MRATKVRDNVGSSVSGSSARPMRNVFAAPGAASKPSTTATRIARFMVGSPLSLAADARDGVEPAGIAGPATFRIGLRLEQRVALPVSGQRRERRGEAGAAPGEAGGAAHR